MKISTALTTLFLLICFNAYSQSGSYELTFSGVDQSTGYDITLDSVMIINLDKDVDTVLKNGNFTFQLFYHLGIDEYSNNNDNDFIVHQNHPNPFTGETMFSIEVRKSLDLSIVLYNLSGLAIAKFDDWFETGLHSFSINTKEMGVLLLSVTDESTTGTMKLVSISNVGNAGTSIKHIGEQHINSLKSTIQGEFTYTLGDQLQFIGYAAGYAYSSIYDSPESDKSYTFEFGSLFYRLVKHHIETEIPCFVNIMFSVEDMEFKGVDNLNNDNFEVFENGSAISPTETFPYIKKINTIPYSLKTVLLLDNSTSVADKLDDIKAAAVTLISTITEKQEFAIFSFSDEAVLMQDFTDDVELLTVAINTITAGFPSTNLYGAFIEGVQHWDEIYSTELIQQGFLVAFTDGDDTQGSSTLGQAVAARGDKKAYMIGLGNELDTIPLNQLSNPGPYEPINDISELEQVFIEIQADIIRYANSFYWLNYMTPKRNSTDTLRLEVVNNENNGLDSYIEEPFSSYGFESVYSGVYLNITVSQLYGIDSLEIDETDPYELKAVTYWAYEPPSYSWASDNENVVTVAPDEFYFNRGWLNFPGIEGGEAYVTVTDDANDYTKTIKVVAYTQPVVSTSAITNITQTSATGGGNVTGDGGLEVTARGVCWNTTGNPHLNSPHTNEGHGTGMFTSSIAGLSAETMYYVRAYATNEKGTSYGEEISFITLAPGLAEIVTFEPTNITQTSALCGGEVIDEMGNPVTSRGICWGANPNPTIEDNFKQVGSGPGEFTTTITGLSPNATYYVKAYATNAVGTAYGNQVHFVAMSYVLPTVTTSDITDITPYTATGGGNVTDGGNASVTARGICWSTSQNPTLEDNFTTDGNGLGNFISSLTGLEPTTTYYVRAYATNAGGTSFGSQVLFSTEGFTMPTVSTSEITNITPYSATGGGTVEDGGNTAVTARGVCWNTSQNPTLDDNFTINGSGMGSFTSQLTNLEATTIYYVRAYATNKAGTSFGNQVSFSTETLTTPTVTTSNISNVTLYTATGGGTVIDGGNTSVTARGVCWSTSQNPTLNDNFTIDGSGTGNFISELTNLETTTTYYVKAYATNSGGISYGSQKSFTTLTPPCEGQTSFEYEGQTYSIVEIGDQCWMAENLNVGIMISGNEEMTNNGVIEKYCYGNQTYNCDEYAGLYQWNEMMQYTTLEGTQGICPDGWHIPTDNEWKILEGNADSQFPVGDPEWDNESFRGFDAGLNLKSSSGWYQNGNGTDLFGFSALPGGLRYDPGGGSFFNYLHKITYLWTSTESPNSYPYDRVLSYSSDQISRNEAIKELGFSVRCLKD